VNDDVAMDDGRDRRAERRRRTVALAGHRGNEPAARRGLADPDPSVRAAAVGALARLGALTVADVVAALSKPLSRCGATARAPPCPRR
jgi:hypothetical protein